MRRKHLIPVIAIFTAAGIWAIGPGIASAATPVEANAVNWAVGKIGSTAYGNLCLGFVTDAYQTGAGFNIESLTNYGSFNSGTYPQEVWTAGFKSGTTGGSNTTPPYGALVFYNASGPGANDPADYSHVTIMGSGGEMISTNDVVDESAVHYETMAQVEAAHPWNTYVGWWLPDASSAPPPAIPAITGTGGDQTNDVSITWSEPAGTDGIASFSIYRDGKQIGSVLGNVLSYDDKALPDGGDLSYQVQAVSDGGSSAISGQVAVPYLPPGQSGLAWVSINGHVDYCRRTGGVNNQTSHVSCTPFSGSSFAATVTSGVLDWGNGVGRAWVNTGKALDYCRQVGGVNNQSSYVACTSFNGTRFGATIRSAHVVDWGYDQGAAWIPTTAGADYCRRVGAANNQGSYIACTPFNGTRFGATIRSAHVVDWGYDT